MATYPASRRMSPAALISLIVVAAVLLGLATLTVIRQLTREEVPTTVTEVLSGQSMAVDRATGPDNIRLTGIAAPMSPGEEAEDTLDTCMNEESRAQLAEVVPEGSEIELSHPGYSGAPGGETWGTVTVDGEDLSVTMVRSGLAVPSPESAMDEQQARALEEAHQEAKDAEVGIYSTDAECTLPAQMGPILEKIREIPEGTPSSQEELDEMNAIYTSLMTDAQSARALLANIPTTGESVSALAWGEEKTVYVDQVDEIVADIESWGEGLQDYRDQIQEEQRRAEEERQRQEEEARRAEEERQRQEEEAREQEEQQDEEDQQDADESDSDSDADSDSDSDSDSGSDSGSDAGDSDD